MAKAKKAATKKAGSAANDQLKKLKAQMAELKKKAATEKKALTAKLKDQKTELTAKLDAAVATAFSTGYEKALADINKFNAARDKAMTAAAKKFESKNKLKAPATKTAKTKKTAAKRKAAPKNAAPAAVQKAA